MFFNVILGSLGIIAANAMLGELTPGMACAVATSPAIKVLIPLNKCNLMIAGTKNEPLPHYIEEAAKMLRKFMEDEKNV